MVDTTAERALASLGLSAETKFRLIGRLPPARIASSRARASESAGCSSTGTRAAGPSAALIGNATSNPSTSVEKINSFRIALLHLISCLPVDQERRMNVDDVRQTRVPSLILEPPLSLGAIATMAATNKCLAHNNKSRTVGRATKSIRPLTEGKSQGGRPRT